MTNDSDVIQHQLLPEQVLKENSTCVVIDETGNPGQDSGSLYLDESRKTWVAVFLSGEDFATATRELPLVVAIKLSLEHFHKLLRRR
jgi:hypothetical protein